MKPSAVVIDASAPRTLDSPVIRRDAKGTLVAAGLVLAIVAIFAVTPFIRFRWAWFATCAAIDVGLLVIVARILLSWYRVRRVWRHGSLVEVTVRKSTLAWKDYHGGAYTLELDITGGSTLTFDYAQGQVEGATHPALVHDGWILVIFAVDAVALKRLAPKA